MSYAWANSYGEIVGRRLKEQHEQMTDEVISEVQYRIERRAMAQKLMAYAGITHSLGNAIDTAEDAKWVLEEWCLEAAKGVIDDSWSPTSVGVWSSCKRKIEQVFDNKSPRIHLDENRVLKEREGSVAFDPRFLAVLVEVCRNRSNHDDSDSPTASVRVALDKQEEIAEISHESACKINDFMSIAERLQRTKRGKWNGVDFIAHFAESIAPGQSITQWRFVPKSEGTDDLVDLPLGRNSPGSVQVTAPAWLVDYKNGGEIRHDPELVLEFLARIPNPTRE
jgi:hypothetical protein